MQQTIVYILNLGFILGISYWYFKSYSSSAISKYYWPALFMKLICGILLGMLFTLFYQHGDTLLYYERAKSMLQLETPRLINTFTSPFVPSQQVRALYFVRLIVLLKLMTQADFWLLSLYFSLFSFAGSYYFVFHLQDWQPKLKKPAIYAFLFFPSIVFWSSGMLKEGVVFGAICLILGVYCQWRHHKVVTLKMALLGIFGIGILVLFKYYIAAVILPLLLFLILFHQDFLDQWGINGLWKKTGVLVITLFVPVLIFLNWLSPNLNLVNLWEVVMKNHMLYLEMSDGGTIPTIRWFDNFLDVLINVPYYILSGMFRPLPGEDFSFPAILSALENFLILLAAFMTIRRTRRFKWTADALAILIYVVVLALFLSFSAPNFGTLARYKVYYMPFVLLLILYSLGEIKIPGNSAED